MSSRLGDSGIRPINHASDHDKPDPQNSNKGVQEAALPGAVLRIIVPTAAAIIIFIVLVVLIYIKRRKIKEVIQVLSKAFCTQVLCIFIEIMDIVHITIIPINQLFLLFLC